MLFLVIGGTRMLKALILAITILVTLITAVPHGLGRQLGYRVLAAAPQAGSSEPQSDDTSRSALDGAKPRASTQASGLPDRPLSFDERCADPRVVLCDPLDTGRVRGAGITARTRNATLPEALQGKYRDWRWCHRASGVSPTTPSLDRDVKISGSGSLKFTVPSKSAANAAGYCQINFTPENSLQFGEGETFFVQFRVRLSCDLLFVDCDPKSPTYKQERRAFSALKGKTGFKVSIINAGDHPDLQYPVSSCTRQELVLVGGAKGIITGYHSCSWFSGHTFRIGRTKGQGLFDLQPIRRTTDSAVRGCYNVNPTTGQRSDSAWNECILWQADEWLTVTQQVTIGQWAEKSNDPARSSNVRVWVAREGQKPVLVIDYDRNLRQPEKPFMKYGKIWLLPYMTNKDPSEVHPEAYMWFDELIVSRGPIAPAR